MRYGMVIIVVGAALQLMSQEEQPWDQVRLERILRYDCEPRDFYPEGEPPYVPLRNRDALKEFETFISHSGWTTNQFIEGLIFAFTNNQLIQAFGGTSVLIMVGVAMDTIASLESQLKMHNYEGFFK